MIATLGGSGAIRTADQWRTLLRGDVFLISPGTRQEYGHLPESPHWSNIWVHFQPHGHWLQWLSWPELSKGVMLLSFGEQFDAFEAQLHELMDASQKPNRLCLAASMNCLERFLIAADDFNPLHGGPQLDARIRKALELVGTRLGQSINVEALGREVGLSRARFSTVFSQQVGVSPQVYIEKTRLARAAQLLRASSSSISQIAQSVGFDDAFYFSTRFRKHFGVSPSAYRSRSLR
ncbi:MAG: helix-turn-helix domain-containing protein [Rhodoferax sp.]|nr:helix-turn-helix domain-containing protein [Rhodoferax sp.]